jgi:hypothetical protein
VQIHGFASQGFLLSDRNNYLTMPTRRGSFALTDGGLNASLQVTSRLRVGAQVYSRNVGQLSNGRVYLDWALADYQFRDAIGVRVGKVKTVFGLYNDTQDVASLHTWALLPQAVYPLDLRSRTIAHLGGDVYGAINTDRWGRFNYTAYAGRASADPAGGYWYGLASYGLTTDRERGHMKGADLKWSAPLPGLLLGVSVLDSPVVFEGTSIVPGARFLSNSSLRSGMLSAQFTHNNWRVDYEQLRSSARTQFLAVVGPGMPARELPRTSSSWYLAAARRLHRHLEVGTYYAHYRPVSHEQAHAEAHANGLEPDEAAERIFDQAITLRLDFGQHWDFKAEGHFMNGYGDPSSFRGFYPQVNPMGLQDRTNLLVLRLGYSR